MADGVDRGVDKREEEDERKRHCVSEVRNRKSEIEEGWIGLDCVGVVRVV